VEGSGCCGLLVTTAPFPPVTANAESVLQNLCWFASILRHDNFLEKSGCDFKNLAKQFPDHFEGDHMFSSYRVCTKQFGQCPK